MVKWDSLYNHLIESKQSAVGELHHIIPRHSNGTNDISNLVRLTHRYHILAHYILYRWKQLMADKIAYKMMSGQIVNPMHDLEIRKYHKQIMNNDSVKSKIANKANARFANLTEREKVSEHRKRYINTLPDKRVMTQHMQTPECRQKSLESNLRIRKSAPEYFQEIQKRGSATVKANNKQKTAEELRKIYSRGSGKHNPNWQGYIIIYSNNNNIIHRFDTLKDATKHTNITPETIRLRMKTSTPMKHGNYKGCYFRRKK